jgi:hypothetical protein
LTTFDLTDQDAVIINGQANMAVTYYLNQTDALNDTSALPSAYTNDSQSTIDLRPIGKYRIAIALT